MLRLENEEMGIGTGGDFISNRAEIIGDRAKSWPEARILGRRDRPMTWAKSSCVWRRGIDYLGHAAGTALGLAANAVIIPIACLRPS